MDNVKIDTALLDGITLAKGGHGSPDAGLCLMEAVAFVRGLAHTDRPPCVSPMLGEFGRSLNDVLPDDSRQQLKPFVSRLPGTAGDGQDEARGYMALDWLIRTYTPAWLELAGLTAEATALRDLHRIVDRVAVQNAGPAINAGRDRARAVGDAARDAAWDAVGDAAGDAAWDAAWGAAWDAARAAAGDAAGDAARDAARDALAPAVANLQRSAIELFDQMIDPSAVTW